MNDPRVQGFRDTVTLQADGHAAIATIAYIIQHAPATPFHIARIQAAHDQIQAASAQRSVWAQQFSMAELLRLWNTNDITDPTMRIHEEYANYIAFRLCNIVANTENTLMPLYFQQAYDHLAEYQIEAAIVSLDEWEAFQPAITARWQHHIPSRRSLRMARANLVTCNQAVEQHRRACQGRALAVMLQTRPNTQNHLGALDPHLLRDITQNTLPLAQPTTSLYTTLYAD